MIKVQCDRARLNVAPGVIIVFTRNQLGGTSIDPAFLEHGTYIRNQLRNHSVSCESLFMLRNQNGGMENSNVLSVWEKNKKRKRRRRRCREVREEWKETNCRRRSVDQSLSQASSMIYTVFLLCAPVLLLSVFSRLPRVRRDYSRRGHLRRS